MVTLTIGWWLAPLAGTLTAFASAWWLTRPTPRSSYGDDIAAMMIYGFAAILSLSAWLVWAMIA